MQLTDLPRDNYGTLNKVRSSLVQLTNSARHNTRIRTILYDTLSTIITELDRQSTEGAQEDAEVEAVIATVEAEITPVPDPIKPKAKRKATAKVNKEDIKNEDA
jgi:hypothetical protein